VEEPRKPRDWDNWIDQQIREAQERGAFDDLPGKGRPLDLTPNPFAQDRELAFKILKDAGYAPDWIELDKAIRGKLERVRADLSTSREWRQARLAELGQRTDSWAQAERQRVLEAWQQSVTTFQEEIAAINADITTLNLKVPAPRFQRSKIDPARELVHLDPPSPFQPPISNLPLQPSTPHDRMAETVRQVVTRRERAPRSPRMERALKRLIWRYTRAGQEGADVE
jgi:DnaJ family protein C protein 28